MEREPEALPEPVSPTSPHMAVAMVLNRELTTEEALKVEERLAEGVQSITSLVTEVAPEKTFHPWEEIVFDMMFRPLLMARATEGD